MENNKSINMEDTYMKSKITCVQRILPRETLGTHEAKLSYIYTGTFKDFFEYMESEGEGPAWNSAYDVLSDKKMTVTAVINVVEEDSDSDDELFRGFEIDMWYGLSESEQYFADTYRVAGNDDIKERCWQLVKLALMEHADLDVLVHDAKKLNKARVQKMKKNEAIKSYDDVRDNIRCTQRILSGDKCTPPKICYDYTGSFKDFFCYMNKENNYPMEWDGRFEIAKELSMKVTVIVDICDGRGKRFDEDFGEYYYDGSDSTFKGFEMNMICSLDGCENEHYMSNYAAYEYENLRDACWQQMKMSLICGSAWESLIIDAFNIATSKISDGTDIDG
jgi:hypothetical protein